LKDSSKASLEPLLLQSEHPSSLNLSSQERCSSPLTIFVALLRTCFSRCMSCARDWGPQSWIQDSRWGLTRAEQRGRIASIDLLATLLFIQPRR